MDQTTCEIKEKNDTSVSIPRRYSRVNGSAVCGEPFVIRVVVTALDSIRVKSYPESTESYLHGKAVQTEVSCLNLSSR